MTALLWILAILLIAVGFVGVVAPALPGPALVYLGIVLIAWAGDFQRIHWGTLVALGLVAVLVLAVDYVASAVGTKRYGGTAWGIGGSVLGLIVGGLLAFPVGLLVGPLLGAILGELIAGRDTEDATRAGWGAFVGFLAGTVVKLALCGLMVAVALLAHFL